MASGETRLLFEQALASFKAGEFTTAIQLCGQLEQTNSEDPGIQNLKALALAQLGRPDDAAQAIERSVALRPDDPTIRYNAARIYKSMLRHRMAIRHARKACAISPEHSGYLYQLSDVYREAGEYEKSLEAIESCLELYPDFEEAWLLKANIQSDFGDREASIESYTRANDIGAPNARAISALSRIRRTPLTDTETVAQLEAIRDGGGSHEDIACATFALAVMHQRERLFDQAFDLFRQANRAARVARPYGIEAYERRVDGIIESSGRYFDFFGLEDHSGITPIFIVGMPRSGSTLCEQVVTTHSQAPGGGELTTIAQLERRITHAGLNYYLAEGTADKNVLGPELIKQARADYFSTIPSELELARWVTDKQLFNYEHLGLIYRLFPGARVLFCTRHPLDTILSCFIQDFESIGFSSNLDDIARVYVCHVRLMQHWQSLLPGFIHQVSYPAMVSDLEMQVRAIVDFIGMDFELAMLEPHKNPRQAQTASKWQVRQAVYTTSIDVWKDYRQPLESVIDLLQSQGLLGDDIGNWSGVQI